MNEQEKQRAAHLLILLCYTILSFVLAGESLLMGWEKGVVVLLPIGVAISWILHIRSNIATNTRLDIYTILMMLVFFYYGIHETSMFDLAPLIITVMVLYSSTESYRAIKICMFSYYFTIAYDLIFVVGDFTEEESLFVSRLIFHLLIVYMAGKLLRVVTERRIRERKTTEDRINRLNEINSRTEDFLANMSHELRTPINAVTGITSVMMKNEEDAEKKKDLFTIQMAGKRLFDQIEDILDYSEIDNKKIIVSEETYMISSIVNDIISENQIQERKHMPELIFDLDAAMPAAFLGDGKKIKTILRHLVDNAVKFTKKGGVYVRIFALRKDYGVNLCITVADTGEGISAEELEKITEGFYQSDGGRDRNARGLGLGLPIVAGMVSCMEGFMQIKSEVGSGTAISVSIPQKAAEEKPMVSLENRERLCLACFLKLEKYELPQVRNFYNETITHMVEGMDISMHRVFNVDELGALTGMYHITHLFIGTQEYKESSALFEELADKMAVIVVADRYFEAPADTKTNLIRKPFYCLPIANILNAEAVRDELSYMEKRMICPGVRILVVDDEPMNLMVAEEIFNEYEMNVTTASGGMAALEICEKKDFDIIFLDHMMPEMDGVETLKRLRTNSLKSGKNLTVVAFTANAVSGAREMFFKEGFDEFVSKPIEIMELERVLRNVLPKPAIQYVDKDDRTGGDTERPDSGQTETRGQLAADKKKTALLEDIGIHTGNGLQYCQNNTEFYDELLKKFVKDAEWKQADIDKSYKQEDWENYCIMVHALKSTARMIGADDFSEQAKRMEDAAKNRNVDYIRPHHEDLLTKYQELVWHIQNIFGEEEKVEKTKTYQEISGTEFLKALEELMDSLRTFESEKAGTMVEQLDGFAYRGDSVAGLLEEANRDIEDFEMEAAAEKVEALICRVKDGEA